VVKITETLKDNLISLFKIKGLNSLIQYATSTFFSIMCLAFLTMLKYNEDSTQNLIIILTILFCIKVVLVDLWDKYEGFYWFGICLNLASILSGIHYFMVVGISLMGVFMIIRMILIYKGVIND